VVDSVNSIPLQNITQRLSLSFQETSTKPRRGELCGGTPSEDILGKDPGGHQPTLVAGGPPCLFSRPHDTQRWPTLWPRI